MPASRTVRTLAPGAAAAPLSGCAISSQGGADGELATAATPKVEARA